MSRSYNIVRPRFWAWAKEKELSAAARELALYCLTSPHTNGIGCFRLPIAYIAEDLGTVPGTVRKTVSELSKIGFLNHDDSTGWVFIVGFLDHNPIANINVGKSLMSFVESVPRKAPFYKAFLDTLECSAERFPEGFIDRMRNGIGNGSPNGMPTHDHDHDHDHEHEHDAGAVCGEAGSPDPIAEAFTLYTDAAKRHAWSIPRKLDHDRRKALSQILKDWGGLDGWREGLAKAESSGFLTGRTPRDEAHKDWRCSLDFLTSPRKFRRLMEGGYGGDMPPPGSAPARGSWAAGMP